MRVRPPRRLQEQQVRGCAPGRRRCLQDSVPHEAPPPLTDDKPSRRSTCLSVWGVDCTHTVPRTWVAQTWRWPPGERVAAAAPPNATLAAACSPARSTRHSGGQSRRQHRGSSVRRVRGVSDTAREGNTQGWQGHTQLTHPRRRCGCPGRPGHRRRLRRARGGRPGRRGARRPRACGATRVRTAPTPPAAPPG